MVYAKSLREGFVKNTVVLGAESWCTMVTPPNFPIDIDIDIGHKKRNFLSLLSILDFDHPSNKIQ